MENIHRVIVTVSLHLHVKLEERGPDGVALRSHQLPDTLQVGGVVVGVARAGDDAKTVVLWVQLYAATTHL